VIIADLRKRFLKRAVESVLSQDLDRKLYEIVVVKRFEDEGLDAYLRSREVRVLKCDDERIGPKYYMGLLAAKGEIIAFLEDDDLWLPGKLSRVFSVFTSYNNVCFYHNSVIPVDRRMHPLRITLLDDQLNAARKFGSKLLATSSLSFRDVEKLFESGAAFNTSSMCISKDFILEYSQSFHDIDLSPDLFLFTLSLATGRLIFLDSEELTMYGTHFDEYHTASGGNSIYNSFVERIPRYITDIDKITSLLNDPRLKRSLDCRKEELRIRFSIMSIEKRLEMLKILMKYSRIVISGLTKRTTKYIAVAVSYLVLPSFTRYLFVVLSDRRFPMVHIDK
jgi:glycosyltransferase involved in cell wall biosynthesis